MDHMKLWCLKSICDRKKNLWKELVLALLRILKSELIKKNIKGRVGFDGNKLDYVC